MEICKSTKFQNQIQQNFENIHYFAGKMENAVPAKNDERRETPPIIQKEIETLSNRKMRDKVQLVLLKAFSVGFCSETF